MTRIYILDQSALSISGHNFGYTACIAEAAQRMGFDVVVLTNVRLSERFREDQGVRVLPIFTWGEPGREATVSWRVGNMAYEMVKAFSAVPPSARDHVLLHTIWSPELRSILNSLVASVPGMEMPHYHILLRFDPSEMGASLGLCFPFLRQIRASAILSGRIHFHSDTHLLSREYERLFGVSVATAPIPFLRKGTERSVERKALRNGNAPLRAVYLGVARAEKGFHYLPGAAAHLWRRYLATHRLELVIQSHFDKFSGDAGILEACQQLMVVPGKSVKLVPHPLSSEQYVDLLQASDIVIIPYYPTSYRLRSSGVLVEALALGKVVVTTLGSWMATQVTRKHAVLFSEAGELGPAIAEAVDHFDILHAGAVAHQEYWWKWSSGDHFVRHLLNVAQASDKPVPMHPTRILFVMDSATLYPQGDVGNLAHANLSYLSEAGYRIVGLLLRRQPEVDRVDDERWSRRLLDQAEQYPFERIFIVSQGISAPDINSAQPSQVNERSAVRHDLDAAGRFTFSAEIYRFLRENQIDVAVLDSIVFLPVLSVLGLAGTPSICAMRELLSFRNAVQERRVVDEHDLDDEMTALAQCDVLLSPSELAAEIIRSRLPRAKILDPGIFLGPPTSSLFFLAGTKNLAEIVSSCQPENPHYQLGNSSNVLTTDGVFPLLDLDAIDLLFIGSEDAGDVSDLRWFLEEVYLPYLEGIGISLAVAGAVCNGSDWPQGRRLFFLGQLRDSRPLYAAARIVVWPVLHDAGRWIRNLEALRYGCPVITTRAAAGAIESKTDGMLIRDDAASFAAAIIDLIAAPAERRKYAEVSASVYQRASDPARHWRTMNEVFSMVLGDRAQPAPAVPIQSSEVTGRIDWSPLVRAINTFIRAVIEGDAVSWEALACIAAAPPKETDRILAEVCEALFVKREAPILSSETWLGELICAGPEPIPYHNLRTALQIALSDFGLPLVNSGLPPLSVIAYSGFALAIAALTATLEGANRPFIRANGNFLPTRCGAMGMPQLICSVNRARPGIGRLRTVELGFGMDTGDDFWPPCAVVAQPVPLLPDLSILGHRVFEAGWRFSRGRRGATLHKNGVAILRIPRVTAGFGTEFVDLLCDGAEHSISRLVIKVAGEIANIQRWTSGSYVGCRALFTRPKAAGDCGYLQVTIEQSDPADTIEVVEIFVGTVIGNLSDGERILSSRPWGVLDQRPIVSGGGGNGRWQRALKRVLSGRAVESVDLSNLAQMIEHGRLTPTGPASGECLAGVAAANSQMACSDIATENLCALVHPRGVKGVRQIMIVSPALTVEGVARKGVAIARRAGATAGLSGRSWLLHRRELAEAGRLRITLPALDDPVTGHLAVGLQGFYRKEEDGSGPPFRWTGPDPNSEIILPIALTWLARLNITIADLGLNRQAADLSVLQDEVPIQHELVLENNGRARLRAVLHPKEIARGSLTLGIISKRMHRSVGAGRRQGIAIEKLELTMEFPRGVSMPRHGAVVSRVSGWVTPRRTVVRRLIGHGNRARDQRDWPTAAAWYLKVLEVDPSLAAIWVQLGHALKEQGDTAGGAEAYRQSLKLADDLPDTHVQLGHVLKLQGRKPEAAEAYFRALLLDKALTYARVELEALGYSPSIIDEALAAGNLPPQ